MSGFNAGSTQPPGMTMTDALRELVAIHDLGQQIAGHHTPRGNKAAAEKFQNMVIERSNRLGPAIRAARSALASHPVPSAPEPGITAELLADLKMQYGMVGTRDVDVAAWNAKLDRAIAALSSAPASAPEPSERLIQAARNAIAGWEKVLGAIEYQPGFGDMMEDLEFGEMLLLRSAIEAAAKYSSAPPVPAAAPAVEPTAMRCVACHRPYVPSRAIAPMAAAGIGPTLMTQGACECGSTQFEGTLSAATLPASLEPASRVEVSEWQPIETAPKNRPILLHWRTVPHPLRGQWRIDEEFTERPRGWVCPEEGWRNDGDQCIPRNQSDCFHWMPLPALPTGA